MPKLRKMLGSIDSQECVSLMDLIGTQSKVTLAAWAIKFAKDNYLEVYEEECSGDSRLRDLIYICEGYLEGKKKLNEIKPAIKEANQIARDAEGQPVAQAAARAICTACSAVQTPTNALGFLFYGAAATAYRQAGLEQSADIYDGLAVLELRKALKSLQEVAVPDESKPVKIKWNC